MTTTTHPAAGEEDAFMSWAMKHPNKDLRVMSAWAAWQARAALSSPAAPAQQEEPGLTAKQAWWAGCRAGKGLPPDTPRQEAFAPHPVAPAQSDANAGDQELEHMTIGQSKEYLIKFMERHFTDKTFHHYIRGERNGVNLAGDFAWQLARALRRIEATIQQTTIDSADTVQGGKS